MPRARSGRKDFRAQLAALTDDVDSSLASVDVRAVLFGAPERRDESLGAPERRDESLGAPERRDESLGAPLEQAAESGRGAEDVLSTEPVPGDTPQRGAPAPAIEQPSDRPEQASYVLIGTGLPPESDQALHVAAWNRGGEGEKSAIVREALGAFLDRLQQLEAADSSAAQQLIAEIRADPRAMASNTPRGYRIERSTRARLEDLARRHRLPMAATVRAAVADYLELDADS